MKNDLALQMVLVFSRNIDILISAPMCMHVCTLSLNVVNKETHIFGKSNFQQNGKKDFIVIFLWKPPHSKNDKWEPGMWMHFVLRCLNK